MGDKKDSKAIVPDGVRYRELKNGAIYDMETKRICANPGGGKSAITQADASAMNKLRWDRAREAAEVGLKNLSGTTGYDSWTEIVEERAKNARDSKGRVGTEDAKFVGRAVGYLPNIRDKSQQSLQNHTQSHPPGTVLRDLLVDLATFKQQMVQTDE